jgi:hypothetical protein
MEGGADYIPRHMNVFPLHVMFQYDKHSMNTASTLAGTLDYRPVAPPLLWHECPLVPTKPRESGIWTT